jgi:MerR family transcriptional regulator, light-induced transcriptional regulator
MAESNLVPTYNLKAVVKETGIKPDTLRAWERRYGLPDPGRTAGGHRLYSRRDIDTIKWLIAREAEGLSISNAVELWRRLISEGRDPLRMEDNGGGRAAGALSLHTMPNTAAAAILELRQAWVDACLAFDEQRAEQVLSHAFALYSPEVVVLELLRRGVVEAGEGWCRGATAVEQEYFASELARRRLEALMVSMPPSTRSGRVVLAAAPEESNTLHPLILTFLLRRHGFDALYVGSNVSVPHLQATVSRLEPDLVVVYAHHLITVVGLLDVVEAVRPLGVSVGFSGAVFNMEPSLRERVAGHFLGEELEEAFAAVETLLGSMPPSPEPSAPAAAYQEAMVLFRQCQASIEARVWRSLRLDAEYHDQLAIANKRVGDTIAASLRLGDIGLLGTRIEWLQCLLDYHCFGDELLRKYVGAYYEAAKEYLDDRGYMVIAWLAQLAAES